MEVATGEYDTDLSKLVASATKKYYEDRDDHVLQIESHFEEMSGKLTLYFAFFSIRISQKRHKVTPAAFLVLL